MTNPEKNYRRSLRQAAFVFYDLGVPRNRGHLHRFLISVELTKAATIDWADGLIDLHLPTLCPVASPWSLLKHFESPFWDLDPNHLTELREVLKMFGFQLESKLRQQIYNGKLTVWACIETPLTMSTRLPAEAFMNYEVADWDRGRAIQMGGKAQIFSIKISLFEPRDLSSEASSVGLTVPEASAEGLRAAPEGTPAVLTMDEASEIEQSNAPRPIASQRKLALLAIANYMEKNRNKPIPSQDKLFEHLSSELPRGLSRRRFRAAFKIAYPREPGRRTPLKK